MRPPHGAEWLVLALVLVVVAVVWAGVRRRSPRRPRSSRGVYSSPAFRPNQRSSPPVSSPEDTKPAGWYPDPTGSGQNRWWDGREWTSVRSSPRPTPGQR
jgi:hypothetical protein